MQFETTEPGQEHPRRLTFFLLSQFMCHREVRRGSHCLLLCSAGRPGCRWRRPEYLLRGIGDVEEAVCVPVVRINLPHAGRHAGHAFLSHQEEQRLGGVQCNLISERREIEIEK